MKKFDDKYKLLQEMYRDGYFPDFLVDKVKHEIEIVITYLETGMTDVSKIQEVLDAMTEAINALQDDFEEHDSEIETVARESIAMSVEYVLNWFQIDIDIEDAIGLRDW